MAKNDNFVAVAVKQPLLLTRKSILVKSLPKRMDQITRLNIL